MLFRRLPREILRLDQDGLAVTRLWINQLALVDVLPDRLIAIEIALALDALAAAGHIAVAPGEALPSIAFGMLGAAGQLLARTPAADRARVREECRLPFVALLAGLGASGSGG